jgi:HAE1 family hydrophobic/amphiphilic exporter-1
VTSPTLGALTQAVEAPGYNEITRRDNRIQITLSITTTRDDLNALDQEIVTTLAGVARPDGYGFRKGKRRAKLAENSRDRNFALSLAILFVFLLMAVLFESVLLPFAIICSIPFAFLGVYWTLYLTDTPFDVMAGVGLVILIGIVVNNAIVLVDRINLMTLEYGDRSRALVAASSARLRPILMTALTTMGGLIPMAIGSAEVVGIPYAPLGRCVIGGLMASTMVTLFVVPLLYSLVDDLRTLLIANFLGRTKTETPEAIQ